MSAHDSTPDSRVVMDVGEGQVVQEAGSWQVRRSLSGGGLPGQARAVSGSSVGSGQVQIVSPAGRSPWTSGPVRPGGRVGIEARADVDRPWSSIAQMVAREVSGTASSRMLDAGVEDRLDDLQRPVVVEPYIATAGELPVPDAAHTVVRMLRAAGLRLFPSMPADAAVYTTFHGRVEVGAGAYTGPNPSNPLAPQVYWGTMAGQAGITGDTNSGSGGTLSRVSWTGAALPKRFFIVLTGTAEYVRSGSWLTGQGEMAVGVDNHELRLDSWGTTPQPSVRVPVDRDPTWGGRTLIEIEMTGGAASSATGFRARAAGSPAGWSPWATANSTGETLPWDSTQTYVSLDVLADRPDCLTGILIGPSLPADAWDPPGARVGLANMAAPPYVVVDSGVDLWQSLQAFATATLGAVWRDEYGAIIYRGRRAIQSGDDCLVPSNLYGVEAPRDRMAIRPEQIVSLDSLDDVPWSISVDDVADRVQVISREVVEVSSWTGSLTVWESTETVVVRGGQTVRLIADLTAAADSPAAWLPVWSTASPAGQQSRWNAFPNPDLTGAQPADTALTVSSTMQTPTRMEITVTNTTGSTLYVSQLTARAGRTWTPTEGRVLSWGASESTARSPYSHDLGAWVQDDAAAVEVLQWLAGTLSQPLPVLRGVRVVPDMDRRLGTICVLTDPVTGMRAKCLISGIDTSHAPGELSQRLDLTVLYTTEWDWGRWITIYGVGYTEGHLATYLTATLGSSATEADLAAWLPIGVI